MLIRKLSPSDAPLVADFYRAAPDYWILAEGACDPDRQALEFFTDVPPGCDASLTHHLGLFLRADDMGVVPGDTSASLPPCGEERGVGAPRQEAANNVGEALVLSGVAELSFGFPNPGDAYLGLMLLGPWAQGKGRGRAILAEVEDLARAHSASTLYLAVLEANPRGRAFWEREGFAPTGQSRHDPETGHTLHRLAKPL